MKTLPIATPRPQRPVLLPIVGSPDASTRRIRDIARGWRVVLFWGGPLAVILLASVFGESGWLTFDQFGGLLVLGTAWFGALCLFNAVRCGRTHCWIDGTLLPALAVVGGLDLVGTVNFPWASYLGALWAILLGSVVAECVVGSYRRPGGR